jgi:ATP/maltotriose-dependent transcriptional regulator MalT
MPGTSAAGVTRRARPGLIGRHMVATLDCAVGKRVTIISAPAGSGQTSRLHA